MSSTRIRTSHFANTIGTLAVVAGLVLGLVPGVGLPTAHAAADELAQCANDQDPTDGERDPCDWQNGNLNSNNSVYAEGDSVGFRVTLSGLNPGWDYQLPINYDILNSGYIAYDQLTSWDRTEDPAPSGLPDSIPDGTATIPLDPHAAYYGIPQATPAEVALWGGSWDSTTPVEYTSPADPAPLPTATNASVTSELVYRFTAGESGTVTIAWGGHIALRQDWNETSQNGGFFDTAPQTTNGSPYHMRFGDDLGERAPDATEYDSSSLGNTDRSLKADAVILPGAIRIVKVDAATDGNFLEGFEFSITGDGVDLTCTTNADGICLTSTSLQPGFYTVTEVDGPDGYVLDTEPREVEVVENETTEVTYVNPRIDYTIDVSPDGRNALGSPHTFTVTLRDDTDTGLVGETIALTWSGAATDVTSVTPAGPDPESLDCTTDSSGQCTVVVSGSVGTDTLGASWSTPYQNATGDGGVSTDGEAVASISDSADKTWVDYVATIDPTATNLVGDEHDFTVTVYEIDGTVEGGEEDRGPGVDGTLVNDVTATVTWHDAPTGSTIDGNATTTTCVTGEDDNADGECVVTVDSDIAGKGTASVTKLVGDITNIGDLDDTERPVNFSEGDVSADKIWREYRALIGADSVNPADSAHKFDVQVQYRETATDSWTNAGGNLTVTWDSAVSPLDVGQDVLTDTDVEGVVGSTCDDGTASDGTCTIVVYSPTTGDRTVTLLGVKGDLLPGDDDVEGSDQLEFTFRDSATASQPDDFDETATKTWLDFGATIEATERNQVGESHTFTIEVFRTGGPDTEPDVPNGTQVTTKIEWLNDDPSNSVTNTCEGEDAGTVNDVCTVTVNSDIGNQVTVTVEGLEGYDFDGGSQPVTFTSQPTASKTWYAYRAWVEQSATNLVGDAHTFYVTAEQNSGGEWVPVPEETDVTVSLSDPTTEVSDSCARDDVAETGGTGDDPRTEGGAPETNVCTVVVNSADPGSVTITVTHVSADAATHTQLGDAAVSQDDLVEGFSTSATKTWIEYYVDIEESATNLTGQEHTFYVTVTQDDGTVAGPVPAGTTVTIWDGNADIDPTGTCTTTGTDASGVCTVVVNSTEVDSITVRVDGVLAKDVDEAPQATFVNGALETADGGARSAVKDWVAVRVEVSADETNIAGEYHRFDVDLVLETPGGEIDDFDGAIVHVSPSGTTGEIVDDPSHDTTCEAGVDGDGEGTTDGTCTVWVHSDGSGELTVTVDGVEFSYGGTDFTGDDGVDLSGTEGVSATQNVDREGTKIWRAYRASIADDGFNRVGDPHPFTITIEQTDVADPSEQDWDEVPNGTTATVAISNGGPGTIDPDGCADPGTNGGTCSVTLTSAEAGTTVVTVSEISVAHPDTGVSTPVNVTDDSADKVWIAFRGSIVEDSVNVTGDAHTFYVDVEYTTDGDTWTQVPDESVVTVDDDSDTDGVGGIQSDTCGSTQAVAAAGETPARVCTVTVQSDDSGSLEVTVESVSTTDITANGITEQFDVTFDDGRLGVLAGLDEDDYDATKTWASYTLDLDPVEAINLLDGTEEDPEQYHDITVTLTSDNGEAAPVGGQVIDLDLSGIGTIVAIDGVDITPTTTTTCTTAAVVPAATEQSSTCVVTIFSSVTGTAELDASFTTAVGDSDPVTFTFDADSQLEGDQGAEKHWTTFRVTVTPEDDENLVDNAHEFVITVEQSDSGGQWTPVSGVTHPGALDITTTGTDLDVDTSDCELPDGTDALGKCSVFVTSSTVQAISLTAKFSESYAEYSSEGEGSAVFTDEGDKDWIDYAIEITPDEADNLVDTDHVMTVTVFKATPDGGGEYLPLPGVSPMVEVASGPGALTGDGTCATGVTNDLGQCTVVLRSSATGLTTVEASYEGYNADADESRVYEHTATKLWWDYELVISDDAVNAVGDEHTFTATLTVDSGGGFGPAAGETLTFTVDGVGTVTGGDTDEELECTTDEAGECDLIINSDEAGATDVSVSYDAVVGTTSRTDTDDAVKQWVDIELVKTAVTGDGFSDGDLIADPGGFPFLSFTSSDQGPKTAVFEYLITNPSNVTLENVVLTDDRLGTIDLADFPACQTLDPGETCTARGSEQFDYFDATASLASLITNVGTVTATGGGEDVSDTDDATITLVAVQSSILIDLVKDVVAGEGDVETVDGRPIVSWSQEEYEAGESKTVRYRFTVTNISNSPIIDVELLDPMISDQPIIAKSDGVTLQPGESTVVEVDHQLTVDEAFPDGPIASKIDNVATVSGANETRDSFSEASDDASVFTEIVFAEVLPATGFGSSGLLPVSMLLITVGAGILWLARRRDTIY